MCVHVRVLICGQTAGPIETNLGAQIYLDRGGVLVKVKVKVSEKG